MNKANVLITGRPGSGKTTFLMDLVGELGIPATGFFTREVRKGGQRVGFRISTLDGREGWLAHVDFEGPRRVGRYGVSLEDLDGIGVKALKAKGPFELVVVDEIGKMECLSLAFRNALVEVLDGERPVLGSIAQRGPGFIERIKERPDVTVLTFHPSKREALRMRILHLLGVQL